MRVYKVFHDEMEIISEYVLLIKMKKINYLNIGMKTLFFIYGWMKFRFVFCIMKCGCAKILGIWSRKNCDLLCFFVYFLISLKIKQNWVYVDLFFIFNRKNVLKLFLFLRETVYVYTYTVLCSVSFVLCINIEHTKMMYKDIFGWVINKTVYV